jgi:CRP/FNR family transcriptional regulator
MVTNCAGCLQREDGPLAQLTSKGAGSLSQEFRTHEFERGQTIFLQGDPVTAFYFLCGGTVKLMRESLEGKRAIVDIIVPCGWFGEFSFQEGGIHSVTAEVLESATVNAVSRRAMAELLRAEPSLLGEMVESLNASLQNARVRVADYAHLPVRIRVLHLLTSLFARYGHQVNGHWELGVPLTRSEIAEILGTTTETAIRMLSQLQKEGHIRLGRRHIEIRDRESLSKLFESERWVTHVLTDLA